MGKSRILSARSRAFPQFVLGYTGLKESVEMGKVILRDEKRLQELAEFFPVKKTFLNDWF